MMTPMRKRARKPVVFATISIASALAACSSDNGNDNVLLPGRSDTAAAAASVRGFGDSALRGAVRFRQEGDSVRVTAAIAGLQPGKVYAIHVHQFGNCSSPEAPGEHFALSGERHGDPFDSLPAHHRGDLPNLQVGAAGIGQMDFMTAAFSLDSADSNSIVGRSVVVHADPDDYVSQPDGNSDGRIACGVIALGNGNDTAGTGADTTRTGTGATPGTGTDTAGTGTDGGTGTNPGNTGVNPGNLGLPPEG